MNDFSEVLSKAKKMQEKMSETQNNIKKIEAEGVAGGDAVKIVLNGENELKKIFIDPKIFSESKEMLEDLIVAAHNDANQQIKINTSEEISKITGGLNLPSGFKFPF